MADIVQAINYIVKTPDNMAGRARIAGRRIEVSDIVNLHLRLGAPIDEITRMYEITPAEVYAALSYYFDHQAEIDADLAEEARLFDEIAVDPHIAAKREQMLARINARKAGDSAT